MTKTPPFLNIAEKKKQAKNAAAASTPGVTSRTTLCAASVACCQRKKGETNSRNCEIFKKGRGGEEDAEQKKGMFRQVLGPHRGELPQEKLATLFQERKKRTTQKLNREKKGREEADLNKPRPEAALLQRRKSQIRRKRKRGGGEPKSERNKAPDLARNQCQRGGTAEFT